MTSSDAPSGLSGTSLGERKLVAVLYADMVGYSRLIGVDDAGTLARLKRLRTELIDPAIAEHRGRIVQTGGDSLLVVFDSIDGAVRCAVKVQQQVPDRDGLFYGIISHTESGRLAEIEARMAVAIDPDDAEAHAALGVAVGAFGDVEQALECGERAVALNRNSASAHYIRGATLAFSGQFAKGRAELLMSLRLNPRDPTSALAASVLAGSWYFEGNYTAAAEMAARCLANYPAHPGPRRFLAAALGQLGRRAEAAAALRDFMDNAPQVFDSLVRQRAPFVRPEDHEHMLEGLRKAGWQG